MEGGRGGGVGGDGRDVSVGLMYLVPANLTTSTTLHRILL